MLSAADKGGDKSQEEQIKQDEALARKLGEQEDAAMARQLADEDRAGNPRQPSRPAAWAPFPAEPAYGQPHSSGTPWNENISCEDDGLFGCGLDWCTGCVVIWCGWLTAAQLYERVKGPRGVFYWIIFGFLMLWILEFFFGTIHYHQARVDQEIEERVYYPDGSYTKHYNFKLKPDVWSSLASFTHFVFLFVCVVLVMLVRTALRRRDGYECPTRPARITISLRLGTVALPSHSPLQT